MYFKISENFLNLKMLLTNFKVNKQKLDLI